MGTIVTMKDRRVTVESDESGGPVKHEMVHQANDLKGAMSAFGVEKVESDLDDSNIYNLKEDFDRQYKEKTKEKIGYFHPW